MSGAIPGWFVLGAAATVGFSFFLMELVWYRMLGPLLGGTIFTFGLILATALLGIGLGGAFYAFLGRNRPATLSGFAYTCLLEALFIALPYALGDSIALFALMLRPLGHFGFHGHLLGWAMVSGVVVLPAAFMSGVQFPMLIALLGIGRRNVGWQVGLTYAWNTVGAMLGSLAGGFGLLPLLTAPGCWRLTAGLLTALGIVTIGLSLRLERRVSRIVWPAITAGAVALLLGATGPTAAWRHSPIGAGRVNASAHKTPNKIENWVRGRRRVLVWEAEGVESSVGLEDRTGLAFIVNGKIDGNAISDGPTQVMSGLLGALLQPHTRKAMVIGLGTGSTAGWLGALKGVERVDVVELEPAILEVARACAPVNQDVLNNPRVKIHLGDAREVLLTTPERYDLVFSEPSNPYRAGIASLFTEEYYQAIRERLEPNGLFVQWLQAYEIDGQAVRSVYATLARIFPHIETWRSSDGDLLLVASQQPRALHLAQLRERIGQEPWRSALLSTWRTDELEGVLARYIGGPELTEAIRSVEGAYYNTDDRTWIEFGFARTLGNYEAFRAHDVLETAAFLGFSRPRVVEGEASIDWNRVAELRASYFGEKPVGLSREGGMEALVRLQAFSLNKEGALTEALEVWKQQPREPASPGELTLVAEGLAELGDEQVLRYLERMKALPRAEVLGITARFHLRQGRPEEAEKALLEAIDAYRVDPWPRAPIMERSLRLADELAKKDVATARRFYEALQQQFAVHAMEYLRIGLIFQLDEYLPPKETCVRTMNNVEPHFPWTEDLLRRRLACYQMTGDPRAELAARELGTYLAREPRPFGEGLMPGSWRPEPRSPGGGQENEESSAPHSP